MKLMKTAGEMLSYCEENHTGKGFSKEWSLNHFRIIEQCLEEDEYAIIAFLARHFTQGEKPELYFANAITNKRIIMGQHNVLGHRLKTVLLNELNDIIMSPLDGFANMLIDTTKLQIRVELEEDEGKNLQKLYNEILPQIKEKRKELGSDNKSDGYVADEIRKLKGLYDEGILTEKEFEEKKTQLLNSSTSGYESSTADIIIDIDASDYDLEEAASAKQSLSEEKDRREKRSSTIQKVINWSAGILAIGAFIYVLMLQSQF